MKCIITLVFLLGFRSDVPPQASTPDAGSDPVHMLRLAEFFHERGNHEATGTEALRFLFAAPNHPYSFYAHYRLAVAYVNTDRIDEAVEHFRAALRGSPSPDLRRPIRWRLVAALINGGSQERAKLELLRLTQDEADSLDAARAAFLLGTLYALVGQVASTDEMMDRAITLTAGNEAFKSGIERATEALDHLATNQPSKNPGLAKALSTILPGSGQMYAGRSFQALTALGVNAGTSYLVYNAFVHGSIVNAGLLVSSIWWRYYQGNRLHAEEHAVQHNQFEEQRLFNALKVAIRSAGSELPDLDWQLNLESVERTLAE